MSLEKKEFCGLFAITNHSKAAELTILGLFALQHRGEEACGISSCDESGNFHIRTGVGQVNQFFTKERLETLVGNNAIGHTRYSVTGSNNENNVQPLKINHSKGSLSIAHNGNITNAPELRKSLEKNGAIFQTSMDSEILLHLIVKSKKQTMRDKIIDSMSQIKGSYCFLILTKKELYAVRDPNGFRPLILGELNNGKSIIVCSETCSLDLVKASYKGEVQPGEIVCIKKDEIQREKVFEKKTSQCIFELVYFSRPDSYIFNQSVYDFRKELGYRLAKEKPVEADMVIPIPDSGVYAALGYSQASGIPFEMAITRNHYVGRSFIQPSQAMRESFARIKLNPIGNIIKGKRIIIVDDSIVRGTTTKERIKNLREAGASSVHMRISCPPIKHPCFFGIDFPDSKKLIANKMTQEEAREYLNLDSLEYISLEGMLAASSKQNDFCHACFSGDYPIEIPQDFSKQHLEF